jgi:hypothetical protein
MKILAVTYDVPRPDQSSGELRFFTLLSLLARKHQLFFCTLNTNGTIQPFNDAGARFDQACITLGEMDLPHVLKTSNPTLSGSDAELGARPIHAQICPVFREF